MSRDRRKRRGPRGKPTNALYNAWYIGELIKALEGKWKPLSDEEAEAILELMRNRPQDIEEENGEVLAWDGVTKIKQPKLVTSQQFFAAASKEDWALARCLLDERKRLTACD
jgi:hypothetical protein